MLRQLMFVIIAATLAATLGFGQDAPPPTPLTITTSFPYSAEANRPVSFPLTAQGGTAPYKWEIIGCGGCVDKLEEGKFQANYSWATFETGARKLVAKVVDSAEPPQVAEKEFTTNVTPYNPNNLDVWLMARNASDKAGQAGDLALRASNNSANVSVRLGKLDLLRKQQLLDTRKLRHLVYAQYALVGLGVALGMLLLWFVMLFRQQNKLIAAQGRQITVLISNLAGGRPQPQSLP